jgi:hypothetical protein
MSVAVTQYDLITDDPRVEFAGVRAGIQEFVQATKELGGLLTMTQAGKILDVPSSQVSVWAARGRIRSKVVLDVKMVSAGDVMALHKERTEEGIRTGGRGMKAPSLADIAKAAWDDIDPMG